MDGPLGGTAPLYVDDLEPLWQVCEDLDVPVHKHSSAPPEQPGAARSGPGVIAIGFAERQFYNHRAVAQMIFAGVFERHPGLKMAFSESGIGWVPRHLECSTRCMSRAVTATGCLASWRRRWRSCR